jgi:hypothetical protein
MFPVVKVQNGGYIQDGVESVYIIHPILSKMIFFSIFLFFHLLWVKIKLLRNNFFLKIQNGGFFESFLWVL